MIRRRWVGAIAVAAVLTACSGDDGDLEAFCERVRDAPAGAEAFDLDPVDLDVDAAIVQFGDALAFEDALRSDAPPALRDDIDVLRAYLGDLVDGLVAYRDGPTPTTDDSGRTPPPPIFTQLETRAAEIEAANRRLTLFVETNC